MDLVYGSVFIWQFYTRLGNSIHTEVQICLRKVLMSGQILGFYSTVFIWRCYIRLRNCMQRSEEVNLLNFEHEEEAISVSEGCLCCSPWLCRWRCWWSCWGRAARGWAWSVVSQSATSIMVTWPAAVLSLVTWSARLSTRASAWSSRTCTSAEISDIARSIIMAKENVEVGFNCAQSNNRIFVD